MCAQRRTWTDELLEAEVRKIAVAIGHFPSLSELKEMGRNDVACQLSRRGGFLHWSNLIGVPRIPSDSDFGWSGEIRLLDALSARGFSVMRSGGVTAPYDLLVDGILRVDVKTARYAEYKSNQSKSYSTGWFFRIGKAPTCDIIALHRFDVGDTFFIPWAKCGSTNITIMNAESGKYSHYRERYDMLRSLSQGLLSAYRAAEDVMSVAV